MGNSGSRDPQGANDTEGNNPLRIGRGLVTGDADHEHEGAGRSVTSSGQVELSFAKSAVGANGTAKPRPNILAHGGLNPHVMENRGDDPAPVPGADR
jgi:hypothetical protein